MKLIQFLSVTKIYDNNYVALDNVSFEIQQGEFVFLIGPSGSGKTTIIKHIIREEIPTEGKIYFKDNDITKFERKHIYQLRRKIGVVFQDYKLILDRNAFENVSFVMEAAGKSEKEIKETVPYVLDIVGLLDKKDAFPEQLSGGEKQRIAIARAIANNPELLIADEPTGNLDPESSWDIVQILTKINNWGTTIIMATHGSDIVDNLSKRVIKMENGKIVKDSFKGKYQEDEEAEIIKMKMAQKKKKSKKGSSTKEDRKNKSSKNSKKTVFKVPKKVKKTSKERLTSNDNKKEKMQPNISLTSRIKSTSDLVKEEFEKKIIKKSQKLDPNEKKMTNNKDNKNEQKNISLNSDIGEMNFPPKLKSILKAFGYDTIASLKKAGFKKISKIDELSTKDLKLIKEILEKFK